MVISVSLVGGSREQLDERSSLRSLVLSRSEVRGIASSSETQVRMACQPGLFDVKQIHASNVWPLVEIWTTQFSHDKKLLKDLQTRGLIEYRPHC
jgi:hypothetical protein